jgi:hypothetical protein
MCDGNCTCNTKRLTGHPLANTLNTVRAPDHIKRFWEFSCLWKASLDTMQGLEGFRISPHFDEHLKAEIEHAYETLKHIHIAADNALESLRKVRV